MAQFPTTGEIPPQIRRLIESNWPQESAGILDGFLTRMFRFLLGDPSAPINVTSPNSTSPAALPDNTPAQSAVFVVSGANLNYTLDGTVPGNSSPVIQIGSVVTLTGQPTLKAFNFVAVGLQAVTIRGHFFT